MTKSDQIDKQGWNIVHYCARHDRLEILDMFLNMKSFLFIQNVDIPDHKGNYPH